MSVTAIIWTRTLQVGDPVTKYVLKVLAERANDSEVCWPSIEKLMLDTELSKSTIIRHIKKLSEAGLIKITKRKGKGQQFMNNIYTLNVPSVTVTLGQVSERHPGGVTETPGQVSERHPNKQVLINKRIIDRSSSDSKAEGIKNASCPEKKTTTPKAPSVLKRFVKPKLSDVDAYMLERAPHIGGDVSASQATKFYDRQESIGWKVGRAPMKDWKAAVRTWIGNDYDKVFTKQAAKRMQI